MAVFNIQELEGVRWVQIDIQDETVRAEAGALSRMSGEITLRAIPPSPLSMIKSAISDESLVRPSYTGSGTINLEPSLGGYYPFEVSGESWILSRGAYWASEGGIKLGLHRERVWTSLWSGEGFIDYKTKVSGHGRVVLNAPGPVHEVEINNEKLVVEGNLVLARTEGLEFRIRRVTKFFQSFLAGESRMRYYEGTGKALVCWTPYWNEFMMNRMQQ